MEKPDLGEDVPVHGDIQKRSVGAEEDSKDQRPLSSMDFTTKKPQERAPAPVHPNPAVDLISFFQQVTQSVSMRGQRAGTTMPKNSRLAWIWNGAKLCFHMRERHREVLSRHAGVGSLALWQSSGMLGIKRWSTFPRGQRKRDRGRQGKEGLGRKWERERERESAGRRGNERILFFFVSVISLLSPI